MKIINERRQIICLNAKKVLNLIQIVQSNNNKLKSLKVANEWRMMKDERWMMKDDDFKLLKGFALRRTDERTNGRTFAIVESLSRLKSFNNLRFCKFYVYENAVLYK